MAEGESITFGDFGAGATFYEEVVGENALSQTSLSLGVQFPWDNTETSQISGGDASSNNLIATQGGSGFQHPVKDDFQRNTPLPTSGPGPVNSNIIQPMDPGSVVTQRDDACAINVRNSPDINSPQHVGPTETLSSAEGAQKSNSLKRRNKKQRDPNYYNNFYNNPELYSGQRQEGEMHTSGGTQSQIVRREEQPPNDPSLEVQVGPEHSLQPGEILHKEEVSQRDGLSEKNSQNVQLDERTTGINVKDVANVTVINENQSSSTNSTSIEFPSSTVPPAAARTDKLDTLPKVPSVQNSTITSHPKIVSESQTVPQSAPQPENKPENFVGSETVSGSMSVEQESHQDDGRTTDNTVQEQQVSEEKENIEGEQTPREVTKAPAVPKPSPWGGKPTSWASLFRKEGANSIVKHSEPERKPISQVPSAEEEGDKQESVDPVTTDKDPQIKKLGEFLKNVQISNKPMFIQPRGLINIANNCYINSILQVIVACPPFYNLFQRLPLAVKRRGPSSTPMLDAVLDLCKQFEDVPLSGKKNSRDVRPGEPFEPVGVYQMLRKVNTTLSIKQGRQEDAEEFLSCLLNGFHEEMIAAMEAAYGPKPQANGPSTETPNGVASDHEGEDNEDEEWEQVGPKKKATITRVADFTRSPIYDIFGGQMRSALHQHGARESAMLQPFFTLQLDIQSPKITSVREALENFGTKEAVHGFMSNKTKTEVEASKRTSLEELPPALILHLKQFVYDKTGGCQKLTKKMDYDMDLDINKELLSPTGRAKIPAGQRTYKLFAVVYHTGKEASGGHYISDYYHVGSNSWIRADDNHIKVVKPHQVLNPPTGFTPYLLVYRRREVPLSHNTGNS